MVGKGEENVVRSGTEEIKVMCMRLKIGLMFSEICVR